MSRGQFYLDKANAKMFGVCSGIADYTGVDAIWVRVTAVLLTLFVSFITIPIYIATAIIADSKPTYLYSDAEEERLLRKMRRRAARSGRVHSDLSDIDRRIADIERHYSTSNSRLAAEIDSLR
ncbi:PspC domain-containing protein [Novosphingobium album (ex Liu et al. 2023)]|uniref:PspC domain-containing protein n=1 Tax=Novosphingobium album (ex Liu et al. 2023) TaxID=3031130 RepID=A0ABT5WSQ2_9SPHN|nr:PspC domain-containing protein [Novosphingobium album (ex Liu et al. 2023)]MDE8653075.1 PspC domain-containing protein [Novosphingobium album (ex Liu et al. 2023)]